MGAEAPVVRAGSWKIARERMVVRVRIDPFNSIALVKAHIAWDETVRIGMNRLAGCRDGTANQEKKKNNQAQKVVFYHLIS